MIRLAQNLNAPVIWASNWSLTRNARFPTSVEVLKSLIQQLLRYIADSQTEDSKSEDWGFQNYTTIADWIHVFVKMLSKIPRVLVVLDVDQQLGPAIQEIRDFRKEPT